MNCVSNYIRCIKFAENIFAIKEPYDNHFIQRVHSALKTLNEGEVGRRLLKKIQNGHHIVWLRHNPISSDTNCKCLYHDGNGNVPSNGSESLISLSETNVDALGYSGQPINSPFYIALAHELIHAYYFSYAKSSPEKSLNPYWEYKDEKWVIDGKISFKISTSASGRKIGPKLPSLRSRPQITENAIRQEHSLPERFGHLSKLFIQNESNRRNFLDAAKAHIKKRYYADLTATELIASKQQRTHMAHPLANRVLVRHMIWVPLNRQIT